MEIVGGGLGMLAAGTRGIVNRPGRVLGLALLISAGRGVDVRAGLVLTAEAPGVQATTQTNVITENFNELAPHGGPAAYGDYTTINSNIGTFTSPGMAIVPADQYGGAGGNGNYFAVGVQSQTTTATLTFAAPQSFFGFEWSAADSKNEIEFFSGTTLLGVFDPKTALGALGSAYYGNPNNRSEDAGEKFAYMDVTDTNGPGITSVVFNNIDKSTGFEIDNMSISHVNQVPTGTNHIAGLNAVPEPNTLMLLGSTMVAAGIGYCAKRRRQVTTNL